MTDKDPLDNSMNIDSLKEKQNQEILQKRAKKLALVPKSKDDSGRQTEYTVFRICHESYGLENKFIKEVVNSKQVFSIPKGEQSLLGTINLRGHLIPIFDVGRIMGAAQSEPAYSSQPKKMNALIVGLQDAEFGFLVDSVLGVEPIDVSAIKRDIENINLEAARFLNGVTEKFNLLDGNILLSDPAFGNDDEIKPKQKLSGG